MIRQYNLRNTGSPGWRRVQLDLRLNGRTTRSFEVINAWQRDEVGLRTLYLLERPQGLRGTSYLLSQFTVRPAPLEVHLYLPAGKRRVLSVSPSRFDEGLLGSDFGYRDASLLIETAGCTFRFAGKGELLGLPTLRVDARPTTAAARQTMPWDRLRYHVCQDPALLLGVDYCLDAPEQGAADAPVKCLRVTQWKRVGKVATATRMVMNAGNGRSSVLILKEAEFGGDRFDATLFRPAGLPSALGEVVSYANKPD